MRKVTKRKGAAEKLKANIFPIRIQPFSAKMQTDHVDLQVNPKTSSTSHLQKHPPLLKKPSPPVDLSPHIKEQQKRAKPEEQDQHEKNQKVIPGYNYESLFRKKSHIRLAKRKIREEPQRRNMNVKEENGEKESKNIQKGHWNQEENKLYHWFLELHNKHFVLKYLRRTDKIFKTMANFIQTREAEQCRSHHQKMQKKYKSFYQILVKLRQEFYGTTNPEVLQGELEECGYKVKENLLITEQELKNEDVLRKGRHTEGMEEDSLDPNESQRDVSNNQKSDLLGENYEVGLLFKNINY